MFRSVISNIGSAYSSSTGKFTAPVNGTHTFSVQFCLYHVGGPGGPGEYSIVLDGNIILALEDYGTGSSSSTTSSTVPQYLRQGQKVWVRSENDCSTCLHQTSNCWNRFSGHLVHNR